MVVCCREELREIAKNAEKNKLLKEAEIQEVDGEWQDRVEEIYDMVFEAAREGKYEFACGAYLEEYNQLTYMKIVHELKRRLGGVMVTCSTTRKMLTLSWGNNEV